MTELNELNVKDKHEIKGEASSSTLVEDLASHTKWRHKKAKTKHKLTKQVKFDNEIG
jgi:hypothetical protein